MKTKNLLRSILLLLCCIPIFSFVSCNNNDDEPIVPDNAKDVIGKYEGKITINNVDSAVTVEIGTIGRYILINKFPVDQIVDSVMTKDERLEAVKSLKSFTYTIPFTAKVIDKNINLTTSPKPILFYVTAKNKVHKIVVTFITKSDGIYNVANKTFELLLKATEVNLDGTKVTSFKAMDYQLSSTKK